MDYDLSKYITDQIKLFTTLINDFDVYLKISAKQSNQLSINDSQKELVKEIEESQDLKNHVCNISDKKKLGQHFINFNDILTSHGIFFIEGGFKNRNISCFNQSLFDTYLMSYSTIKEKKIIINSLKSRIREKILNEINRTAQSQTIMEESKKYVLVNKKNKLNYIKNNGNKNDINSHSTEEVNKNNNKQDNLCDNDNNDELNDLNDKRYIHTKFKIKNPYLNKQKKITIIKDKYGNKIDKHSNYSDYCFKDIKNKNIYINSITSFPNSISNSNSRSKSIYNQTFNFNFNKNKNKNNHLKSININIEPQSTDDALILNITKSLEIEQNSKLLKNIIKYNKEHNIDYLYRQGIKNKYTENDLNKKLNFYKTTTKISGYSDTLDLIDKYNKHRERNKILIQNTNIDEFNYKTSVKEKLKNNNIKEDQCNDNKEKNKIYLLEIIKCLKQNNMLNSENKDLIDLLKVIFSSSEESNKNLVQFNNNYYNDDNNDGDYAKEDSFVSYNNENDVSNNDQLSKLISKIC